MSLITLHAGDNRVTLRRLIAAGVRVHSVVCDPPYHLDSIQKRFGAAGAKAAQFGSDGAFSRASKGFCGSKWDGADENGVKIAFDADFWKQVNEILLPGGYLLAFSSCRTYHRMAVAIEDAGFVIHSLKGWVFGSGMPKAHNAAMAIDKSLGLKGTRGEPKSAAHAGWIERGRMRGGEDAENHEAWQRPWMGDSEKVDEAARRYIPASQEAEPWDGWAFGAPLKPALEPICFAQKPLAEKTFAKNMLVHGVGSVNVDACRPGDRHPANLLHDGSAEVIALFPESKGQQAAIKGTEPSSKTDDCYGEFGGRAPCEPRNDSGSAARFFNSFPINSDPFFYHGKAKKADKAGSSHPTVKPVALMQWLVRLVTPPGGTVLDPFAGSGTTGAAARAEGFDCILMEAEEQFIADIRNRFSLPQGDGGYEDEFDALLGEIDEFEALLG
jgi:site-specific DNA-methyltransferase (adenine-specific)